MRLLDYGCELLLAAIPDVISTSPSDRVPAEQTSLAGWAAISSSHIDPCEYLCAGDLQAICAVQPMSKNENGLEVCLRNFPKKAWASRSSSRSQPSCKPACSCGRAERDHILSAAPARVHSSGSGRCGCSGRRQLVQPTRAFPMGEDEAAAQAQLALSRIRSSCCLLQTSRSTSASRPSNSLLLLLEVQCLDLLVPLPRFGLCKAGLGEVGQGAREGSKQGLGRIAEEVANRLELVLQR